MAGLALHNGFIIPKPLEYFVMPFYAFGNKDLAGFGRITTTLHRMIKSSGWPQFLWKEPNSVHRAIKTTKR
jgi:hypothetical protein